MGHDAVVRLRGLPFRASAKSIREFFERTFMFAFLFALSCITADAIVAPNDTTSILITTDYDGRSSGEAYVQLADPAQLDKALKKNLQHMEHRCVIAESLSCNETVSATWRCLSAPKRKWNAHCTPKCGSLTTISTTMEDCLVC